MTLRFSCVVFILFASSFWALADSSDNLEQAFELRFSHPAISQNLLSKTNISELTDIELIKYQYVKAYHVAITSSLDSALVILKSLTLKKIEDTQLTIAILSTELAITTGLKSWTDAFDVLARLKQLLYKSNSHIALSVRQNAEFGIANFLEETEQYEEVVKITAKLLTEPISVEFKCKVFSLHLPATFSVSKSDGQQLLPRVNDVCKSNTASISSYLVRFEKIKITWSLKKTTDVLEQALALEQDLIVLGYLPLTRLDYGLIAEMALSLGNTEQAIKYALKTIGDGKEKGYYKPVLAAYLVAAKAYWAETDYKNSAMYYEKFIALNQIKFSEEGALQLAIQHAKFEVESYEFKVATLDNQNNLLQTKAELAKKRMENTLLVLVLIGLVLVFLLYWAWRAKKLQTHLQYAADIDFLTGAYNRGFFTHYTVDKLTKLRAKNTPLSILLFDLDHFKRINDSYGHQTGDWALKATVRAIKQHLAKNQILARMGGEEFGIILEGKTADEALNIAEQCRNIIQSIDTQATKQIFTITASFGVSDTQLVGYDFDNLMSAADLALYQSKRQGRNKVYEYSNTLSFSKP